MEWLGTEWVGTAAAAEVGGGGEVAYARLTACLPQTNVTEYLAVLGRELDLFSDVTFSQVYLNSRWRVSRPAGDSGASVAGSVMASLPEERNDGGGLCRT